MAENIGDQENRGNEIAGLVNWSLPWVGTLAFLCFLISSQEIFLALKAAHFWQFNRGLSFLFCGVHLGFLFRFGKKYVATEKEIFLGKVMAQLSSFWTFFAMAVFFTVVIVVAECGGDSHGVLFSIEKNRFSWIFISSIFVLLAIFISIFEKNPPFATNHFTKQISVFAKISFSRTRFVSFLTVLVGLFSILSKTVFATLPIVLWGISFLILGTALGFYWKSIREVNRNPSLIYFERTMERLNLYWLVACACFGFQFISNFF